MKLASIVGARPNFMKLAPLSKELRKEFDGAGATEKLRLAVWIKTCRGEAQRQLI